jgi:hypothetical protein
MSNILSPEEVASLLKPRKKKKAPEPLAIRLVILLEASELRGLVENHELTIPLMDRPAELRQGEVTLAKGRVQAKSGSLRFSVND